MFNWYRASAMVVPPPGIGVAVPDWVLRPAPRIAIPVRIIWGLEDRALLPLQLEGIGEVGTDVEVIPLPGVGHFAPGKRRTPWPRPCAPSSPRLRR